MWFNHNRIKRGRNGTKLHVSHRDNLTVVLGKDNMDSGPRACGPGMSVFSGFFVTPPNDVGSPRKLTRLFTGVLRVVSGHGFTSRVNVLTGPCSGPIVWLGLGSGPLYSYRDQTLYRRSYGGIGSRHHVLGSGLGWALFGPDVSLGLVRARCAWIATNRSRGCSRAWFLVVIPGGQTSWTCCRVTCWNDVWRVSGHWHVNKASCLAHRSSSPVHYDNLLWA
ncbi:hypothetical protein HanPSC8_Chr06g0266891 [Helianthus annuus]|nr:hypothetical protein HanPSC8_Chr06g0266891 [Helianthus annuus]